MQQSFSLGYCAACLFLLVIVLHVFFSWLLCCMSFSPSYCAACLFLLVIVLHVFFSKDMQHNNQEKKTCSTITKRKRHAAQ
jgi:Ca2+/Na+ antiporter